jgi:hypothetical protein
LPIHRRRHDTVRSAGNPARRWNGGQHKVTSEKNLIGCPFAFDSAPALKYGRSPTPLNVAAVLRVALAASVVRQHVFGEEMIEARHSASDKD